MQKLLNVFNKIHFRWLKNILPIGVILLAIIYFFLHNDYVKAEDYRDPFKSYIPSKEEVAAVMPIEVLPVAEAPVVTAPTIIIQGVLWGTSKPQTIIDGNVYGVDDSFLNGEAKILKIEKNVVTVVYKGKNFEMAPQKKHDYSVSTN